MTDATSYSRQSRWFFILVCANFTLLAVLFVGLGILLLQSIGLVRSLRSDLPRAEEAAAVDRIVGSAVKSIREKVRQAVPESEPMVALATVPGSIEQASASANEMAEILRGPGEGLDAAAEKRNPEG